MTSSCSVFYGSKDEKITTCSRWLICVQTAGKERPNAKTQITFSSSRLASTLLLTLLLPQADSGGESRRGKDAASSVVQRLSSFRATDAERGLLCGCSARARIIEGHLVRVPASHWGLAFFFCSRSLLFSLFSLFSHTLLFPHFSHPCITPLSFIPAILVVRRFFHTTSGQPQTRSVLASRPGLRLDAVCHAERIIRLSSVGGILSPLALDLQEQGEFNKRIVTEPFTKVGTGVWSRTWHVVSFRSMFSTCHMQNGICLITQAEWQIWFLLKHRAP